MKRGTTPPSLRSQIFLHFYRHQIQSPSFLRILASRLERTLFPLRFSFLPPTRQSRANESRIMVGRHGGRAATQQVSNRVSHAGHRRNRRRPGSLASHGPTQALIARPGRFHGFAGAKLEAIHHDRVHRGAGQAPALRITVRGRLPPRRRGSAAATVALRLARHAEVPVPRHGPGLRLCQWP